MSEDLKAK